MTNDQTVTQADRDAAAPFATGHGYLGNADYSNGFLIRNGHLDAHPIVQAFARHRTAHLGDAERWERIAAQRLVEISDKADEIARLTTLVEAHSGEGRSNGAGEDVERLVRIFRSLPLHGDAGCDKLTDDEWQQVALAALTDISLSAPQGKGRDNAAGFISVREHREGFPLNEAWLLYGHGDEEVIAQKIVRIDRKTLLGQALPADVVRLVIAARKIALNDWDGDSEEWAVARKELDQASEAFASRVPWDNEPNDAALAQPEK